MAENNAQVVVSVRDLWMTYPGKRPGQEVLVLERCNLEVRAGEFVCIVGPSGCGKSTLLNIVGGFLKQTRGEVLVEGQPVRGADPRRIFVFQENGVFPWLTVQDNIGFGLLGKSGDERAKTVAHYIGMVGLEGFERAYPRELSGGMKQRVEIARALAAAPDIIYMDEPFGALDFITRLKMRSDLTRIWQNEKKTILFVTHDIEEAVQLADRVLIMSRRPATVQTVVPVSLARPRDLDSRAYIETRDHIFAAMGVSLRIGEEQAPSEQGGAVEESAASTMFFPALPEARASVPVIIIGGGPAGATLGAYLARANINHLILDQARHPRPHVGESLLCGTTRILQEIEFLPVMERERFVHKHGALWTHWADQEERVIRFREMAQLGFAQDYTYHVDRSRFDQLLLQHAGRLGSQVMENIRVERVEFGPDGRVVGVLVKQGSKERLLRCQVVVDASGRGTLLGSQLRLKHPDAFFNQFAVHNWFEGVEPGRPETSDYIHIHILPLPRAWAWMIPVSPTVTSVGIVTQGPNFLKGKDAAEDFFAHHIASHPILVKRMANTRPIHAFAREGNYSYTMDRFAGHGWLMVGDAARFIDPMFSSGISVAMESARRAAAAITRTFDGGTVQADSFLDYEQTMRAGLDIWREFILLYHDLPPLFLDLISQVSAREQFTMLLQGAVFDRPVVPILGEMRAAIQAVADNPQHPWYSHLSKEFLASRQAEAPVMAALGASSPATQSDPSLEPDVCRCRVVRGRAQ